METLQQEHGESSLKMPQGLEPPFCPSDAPLPISDAGELLQQYLALQQREGEDRALADQLAATCEEALTRMQAAEAEREAAALEAQCAALEATLRSTAGATAELTLASELSVAVGRMKAALAAAEGEKRALVGTCEQLRGDLKSVQEAAEARHAEAEGEKQALMATCEQLRGDLNSVQEAAEARRVEFIAALAAQEESSGRRAAEALDLAAEARRGLEAELAAF